MKHVVLILALALAACGTSETQKSIGSGTDAYKESPCACGPLIVMPNVG